MQVAPDGLWDHFRLVFLLHFTVSAPDIDACVGHRCKPMRRAYVQRQAVTCAQFITCEFDLEESGMERAKALVLLSRDGKRAARTPPVV